MELKRMKKAHANTKTTLLIVPYGIETNITMKKGYYL